ISCTIDDQPDALGPHETGTRDDLSADAASVTVQVVAATGTTGGGTTGGTAGSDTATTTGDTTAGTTGGDTTGSTTGNTTGTTTANTTGTTTATTGTNTDSDTTTGKVWDAGLPIGNHLDTDGTTV